MAHEEAQQQHPIKLYLAVWGWLFVLSTCSYLVDYFGIQGMLRWFLILLFMVVKAGLIVAVFMHMAFERLALMYAILVPPGAVLLFVTIMAFESDYTHVTRIAYFGPAGASAQAEELASAAPGSETGNAAVPPAQVKKPDQVEEEAEINGLNFSEPEGTEGASGQTESLASAAPGSETGKAAIPPDQVKAIPPNQAENEAEKPGPGASKPEQEAEGRVGAVLGGGASTKEAGTAGTAGTSSGAAVVATNQNDAAAAVYAPEWKIYTLKPGDTLWKVAEAEYGRGRGGEYRRIVEANKPLLSNPRKIHPGQALRIPPPPP